MLEDVGCRESEDWRQKVMLGARCRLFEEESQKTDARCRMLED